MIQYEGLQSLIRFEWCSGETEEPARKISPKASPLPTVLLTPPESQIETISLLSRSSIPSTPELLDYTSDTVEFSFPEPDNEDEIISQITDIGSTEAFHLLRAWPLSNGTGFETPDLPYVHFFLNQMPNYLWFAGITQPVNRYIMAKALEQPVLQHAVLCTSAALLSERLLTDPSRFLEHKQKTLALLRGHIDRLEIDEGVAAAVFFMLFVDIGVDSGARSHLRGLKSVLDYLKRQSTQKVTTPNSTVEMMEDDTTLLKLPKAEFHNPDITGVSPLAWLIWAWGIRMDIGLATIDGSPMIAPLPAGPEHEAFHRSWIASLSDPCIPDSADWGLANFTLDNIMHRGCHVARKAKVLRASPKYTSEDEAKILRLCQQLERDLEAWRQQPLLQRAEMEEMFHQNFGKPVSPECCFLHYPPLVVHNRTYSNLITDYRTARIYLSLVQHPAPGPGLPGSGRFQNAVEICRVIASTPLQERDDIRGAEEAMCLFLAGVAFGGDDYYPLESRWTQKTYEEYFPKWNGAMSKESLLGIWLENCPCVPMVREKNFPWTIMSSIGMEHNGDTGYHGCVREGPSPDVEKGYV
jgi:hypothetical protein